MTKYALPHPMNTELVAATPNYLSTRQPFLHGIHILSEKWEKNNVFYYSLKTSASTFDTKKNRSLLICPPNLTNDFKNVHLSLKIHLH